jgi:hypothetical protein
VRFSGTVINEVICVKLENLSFRQVAFGIFLLAILNWALLQFVALPNMSEQDRKGIYTGWIFSPYSYAPAKNQDDCDGSPFLTGDDMRRTEKESRHSQWLLR